MNRQMIQTIVDEKSLKGCLYYKIEDEGVEATIDSGLTKEQYVGIKVDDYYAGLHQKVIPMSVDFVVPVDCECNSYVLYVLEMKGVKNPPSTKEIHEKFNTTMYDFLQNRYKDVFLNPKYKYKNVFLYLVTTAYKKAVELGSFKKYEELMSKMKAKDTLFTDSKLSAKPYIFRGKAYYIQREVPPNPVICKIT